MAQSSELRACFEHSILHPGALPAQVHKVVADAMAQGVAGVCVPPVWVSRTAMMLRGAVKLSAAVSFPHGTSKPTLKAIEATSSIKDGADEIEVVPHLASLLRCDIDSARLELMEIVRSARATRRDVVIKVIVESALLMALADPEAAIEAACRAARESGCDGVVTSTGFHPAGGATIDAVRLLRKHGQGLLVKAAGGIADLAEAQALLDAGADRIDATAIHLP